MFAFGRAVAQSSPMNLPPNIQSIVDGVVASGRTRISLNELSDLVVEDPSIGNAEIEVLIHAFESRGIEVGDSLDISPAQQVLVSVLQTAHAIRKREGRAPSVDEIAHEAGLEAALVRRSLSAVRRMSDASDPEGTER